MPWARSVWLFIPWTQLPGKRSVPALWGGLEVEPGTGPAGVQFSVLPVAVWLGQAAEPGFSAPSSVGAWESQPVLAGWCGMGSAMRARRAGGADPVAVFSPDGQVGALSLSEAVTRDPSCGCSQATGADTASTTRAVGRE